MVELDRATWAEKTDLFLLFVAATIGPGNLYAFPVAVYKNGCGVFLLIYVAFMVAVGHPLYLLEAILGQFSSCGPLHVFSCFPLVKGLGLSMCLMSALRAIDGALVLAQGLLYWVGSLQLRMPWMDCNANWNADRDTCFIRSQGVRICKAATGYLLKREATLPAPTAEESAQLVPLLLSNSTLVHVRYSSFMTHLHGCVNANESSAQQYYFRRIMHGGSGLFNMDLLLCYLTVWTLVFLACTHMRFYIRVLRLVAPSTVVVLLMLLMGALRLPGAWSGIRHMVSFDTARLWETVLWHGATSGVLTSLGVATGSIFVFASFNQITTPVIRVVQGVVWLDLATSLVSCCLLFSVLGNLAHSTMEPMGDIFTGDGTSMMYVLCSELIGQLHFPQLWASLMSLVIFQLGLNQAIAGIWTLIMCLTDEFTLLRPFTRVLLFLFCGLGCLVGLPFCTRSGYHLSLLVGRFAVQVPVLLVACLELLAFVWGYGTDRLVFDVAFMQQVALARSLVRRWRRVSPLASLVAAGVSLTAVHVYVDEMQAMGRPLRFAAIAMVVLALAAVPPLVVTWLLENNWDVELSLLPCAHWGPREPQQFRAYHEAMKTSSLPAQKKVHRTDRKETVAERFTLYLVRHSPKYVGRFIRPAATDRKVADTTADQDPAQPRRSPFPCE